MKRQGTALILGGSSGLGLASAKKLARHGYDIIIIHRDKRTDILDINKHFKDITLSGVRLQSHNLDAGNPEKRAEALANIGKFLAPGQRINVIVHSIAKGSLKSMNAKGADALGHQDFSITMNLMALSLYDWTKDLLEKDLFAADTRIISFTSEGNTKALSGYAAVSAAKVTLEAITRSMALEFAPLGIKANCVQAGVTETQAFSMIPGSEKIKQDALKRNPNGRLTTPEDVANVVYLLTTEEAKWITGTIIKVDGGESLR